MKNIGKTWIVIFTICTTPLLAQTIQATPEETRPDISGEEQFLSYVDTMEFYLYQSNKIVEKMILNCEAILNQTSTISDSARIFYCINKINYNLNFNHTLEAYQTIVDHEAIIHNEGIPEEKQQRFSYLHAYTLMMLGDLDEAQNIYYQDLEKSKINKDTVAWASTLYSLGQLYSDKKEYQAAEKCYFEVFALAKTAEIPSTTVALLDYELTSIYIKQKMWDKASSASNRGLAFSKKEKVDILIPYFLAYQVEIAIEKGQTNWATAFTKEVNALALSNGDDRTIQLSQKTQAATYRHKGQYRAATKILLKILNDSDPNQLEESLEIYEQLFQIYDLMNKPDLAFKYVLQYNAIKEEQDAASQKQQTAFLKIKFETEEQKAANQLLALEVKEEQHTKQALYLISILFLLMILVLFAAFYQKRNYSRILKKEVKKRTAELVQVNKTLSKNNKYLDEFNHILAHDLREPLRSIIGFSHLVKSEKVKNAKVKEYINFIEKSGRQLNEFINGIASYRSANEKTDTLPVVINTASLLQKIEADAQSNYSNKKIEICTNKTFPSILAQEEVLQMVFKQLIDNGIKFNKNKQAKVVIDYQSNEQFHVFEFTDNGIGIDEQFHQQVFGMCKRLHNRNVYEGSGLGLSISQKILESKGGRIALLRSAEEKGSTFRVEVPVLS